MTQEKESRHAEISRKLLDTDGMTEALKKAARQAIIDHARTGDPIVVWRDQKIVIQDANAALNELNE